MKEIKHWASSINIYFENSFDILPSDLKDKIYTLNEIEVFKVSMDNNKEEDEEIIQNIYRRLEDEYYISNFKSEEEIKQKIRELKCNMDDIINWIESIM